MQRHVHDGDMAIYDALVRMSQDFVMRMPLDGIDLDVYRGLASACNNERVSLSD